MWPLKAEGSIPASAPAPSSLPLQLCSPRSAALLTCSLFLEPQAPFPLAQHLLRGHPKSISVTAPRCPGQRSLYFLDERPALPLCSQRPSDSLPSREAASPGPTPLSTSGPAGPRQQNPTSCPWRHSGAATGFGYMEMRLPVASKPPAPGAGEAGHLRGLAAHTEAAWCPWRGLGLLAPNHLRQVAKAWG